MRSIRLRADELQWLATGGEIVALDESELEYLSTNPSGALLWEQLARGTNRAELVGRLIDSFGIERAVAERDVDAFLADLDARGLLDR
jgi:hypothetical protein